MLEWLTGMFASGVAKSVLGIFGDKIVQPFINAYLKSKDVDLEKFKSSSTDTQALAVAVLDANVRYAETKASYNIAILQWWPFRFVLFLLLAVCAVRFSLIVFDSTYWWIVGCTIEGRQAFGNACSWDIPPIRGAYGNAEQQFLLFFIVMKPVDSAVTGAMGALNRYLVKK